MDQEQVSYSPSRKHSQKMLQPVVSFLQSVLLEFSRFSAFLEMVKNIGKGMTDSVHFSTCVCLCFQGNKQTNPSKSNTGHRIVHCLILPKEISHYI